MSILLWFLWSENPDYTSTKNLWNKLAKLGCNTWPLSLYAKSDGSRVFELIVQSLEVMCFEAVSVICAYLELLQLTGNEISILLFSRTFLWFIWKTSTWQGCAQKLAKFRESTTRDSNLGVLIRRNLNFGWEPFPSHVKSVGRSCSSVGRAFWKWSLTKVLLCYCGFEPR